MKKTCTKQKEDLHQPIRLLEMKILLWKDRLLAGKEIPHTKEKELPLVEKGEKQIKVVLLVVMRTGFRMNKCIKI